MTTTLPGEKNKVRARAVGTGLSSPTEPQEGLGPTGFDPSRELLLARFAVALAYQEEGTRTAIICGAWDGGTAIDAALRGVRLGIAFASSETTEAERA